MSDYAQTVDIGYDYENDQVIDAASIGGFEKSFSDVELFDDGKSEVDTIELSELKAELKDSQTEKSEKNSHKNMLILNRASTAEVDSDIADLNTEISNIENRIAEIEQKQVRNSKGLYTETTANNQNIYQDIINGKPLPNGQYGDIETTVGDTVERLKNMKEKLLFQPTFFSGDKYDFRERLRFIQKSTKPAKNLVGRGFAFTRPPLCHLRLGDWFNHDIIINTVSYNYENSPWTFDRDGKVQPMIVSIQMNFNIVSEYHDASNRDARMVPLADDTKGFFGGDY